MLVFLQTTSSSDDTYAPDLERVIAAVHVYYAYAIPAAHIKIDDADEEASYVLMRYIGEFAHDYWRTQGVDNDSEGAIQSAYVITRDIEDVLDKVLIRAGDEIERNVYTDFLKATQLRRL